MLHRNSRAALQAKLRTTNTGSHLFSGCNERPVALRSRINTTDALDPVFNVHTVEQPLLESPLPGNGICLLARGTGTPNSQDESQNQCPQQQQRFHYKWNPTNNIFKHPTIAKTTATTNAVPIRKRKRKSGRAFVRPPPLTHSAPTRPVALNTSVTVSSRLPRRRTKPRVRPTFVATIFPKYYTARMCHSRGTSHAAPVGFSAFSRYPPKWDPRPEGCTPTHTDRRHPTVTCGSTLRGSTLAPSTPRRTSPHVLRVPATRGIEPHNHNRVTKQVCFNQRCAEPDTRGRAPPHLHAIRTKTRDRYRQG